MAMVPWTVSATVSISTIGVKTWLQLLAATNVREKISRITLSGDNAATAVPVSVELLVQTDAGTTTGVTPAKMNAADDEALQVSAGKSASVEPTPGAVLFSYFWHPGSVLPIFFPTGLPIKGGTRFGIRQSALAAQAGNVTITIEGEE